MMPLYGTINTSDILSSLIKYRKIPVISPGLIKLRKGFWVGL